MAAWGLFILGTTLLGLGLNGFKAGYCSMEVLIWLILARGIGNLGDLKAGRARFQRLRRSEERRVGKEC